MDSRIQKLPPSTRDNLRSTFIIQSLPVCILELVYNALDAQAKAVEIGFSLRNWECRVIDNGTGIDPRSLHVLGQRYHTSKSGQAASASQLTYGSRGEAISSIADVALVEITTRHHSSPESYTLILRGDQIVYCGPAKHGQRSRPGTSVIVRDLFYKWPVRRKDAERSQSFATRCSLLIKKAMEAVALLHHDVTFQVVDQDSGTDGELGILLSLPRPASSCVSRFGTVFGRALVQDVHHFDASCGDLRAQGFFSMSPSQGKAHQFIYVNDRHIPHCELQHLIKQLVGRSSFARKAEIEARNSDRESSPHPGHHKSTESPRKRAHHLPVYCLRLFVNPNTLTVSLEPERATVIFENEVAVQQFIRNIVDDFLLQRGFLAAKTEPALDQGTSRPTSPAEHIVRKPKAPVTTMERSLPSDLPRIEQKYSRRRLSKPVTNVEPKEQSLAVRDEQLPASTMPARRFDSDTAVEVEQEQVIDTTGLRTKDTTERMAVGSAHRPEWLTDLLGQWANPVFRSAPREIKSADQNRLVTLPSQSEDSTIQQISKQDLVRAAFIAQVDAKFLLCSLSRGDASTLILVDQHAADERIRFEAISRAFCAEVVAQTVSAHSLVEARRVLVSKQDALNVKRFSLEMAKLGLRVRLEADLKDEAEYAQVLVEAIPALFADRLSADDRLLKQVLLDAILHIIDHDGSIQIGSVALQPIRVCPPALLDLIKSKACRGAIMFNDTLEERQCQDLLERLSHANFPFSCAHGRPSMVPLINMQMPAHRHRTIRKRIDWAAIAHVEILRTGVS